MFLSTVKYVTTTKDNVTVERMDTDTYYFDNNGRMATGWIQAGDGNWYYFEAERQDTLGQMKKGGIFTINGRQYIFAKNGGLYVNITTDDGYKVNENGQVVAKLDAYGKMRLV